MPNVSLKGKKIWLTGASRGIGAAIARRLKNENATLILSSRTIDSLRLIMPEFAEIPSVFFLPCDISSVKDVKRIYEKIDVTLENVDILINNAGAAVFAPFNEMSLDDFDKMNDVNYRGAFLCTKAVLPSMLERKSGTIINILSGAVVNTFKNSSIYAASKAAVRAMSRSLREEVRGDGIKVINILPGAVETDLWDEESQEKFHSRMMQPEDVAEVVYSTLILSLHDRLMVEDVVFRPQGGDL